MPPPADDSLPLLYILQLAHYGVDLKTFLDVSTTGFSYTVANGATPKYISWSTAEGGSGVAPENVTAWCVSLQLCCAINMSAFRFAALIQCYEATFSTATGGTEFIEVRHGYDG